MKYRDQECASSTFSDESELELSAKNLSRSKRKIIGKYSLVLSELSYELYQFEH
ncbi:unnamed protein product, partial [Rotaria sp. Silwood1]